MFSQARAFTEELLRENERLRFRVAGLGRELEQHGTPGGSGDGSQALEARVRELEKERDDLLRRFRQVEEINRSFASRYDEIESQNNQLANLYVASYQLHATLNFAEVVDTVREILINLVGAEAFALYWVDEKAGHLKTEASQGMGDALPSSVRAGSGPLARAAREGESYYADPLPEDPRVDPARPIACIPLKIGPGVIGVIAIYRLLQQKERFTPLDFEMFTLLAGHAATALFSSKLYQRSEQKLSNLQGFLDMLTAPSP
ncbi:MAG: diguanylate phosphodiesterase [Acidobacteria bacterium]|nr:MAG: diguanylate phosphodiesterase [Acidobacteriota bacterium]